MLAIKLSKFEWNPTTPTDVINWFRLKEHLYTFELPPKRNPPPIELIFTGQHHNTLAMFPTKFDQNPMTPTEVINWFQLKEHLYTFELPPKRNPLRLSSYSQGSITTHLPCTPPNLNEIQWPSLKLLTDSNSKSTYIPLSCHQIAIPLRLSSYSQGSITTHSPCTPPIFIQIHHHSSELHTFLCSPQKHEFFDPLRLSSFSQGSTSAHSPCSPQNFIQIQRHTPELHSTPTQRALIYLWISQISDFAHIRRVAPVHTAHANAPGPIDIQRRTSELQSFY